MSREAPRALSIPPGVPFLPTLAEVLLRGELVPGFRHDGDPLALAEITIYVPTRRAARALRTAFVDAAGGGRAAILPVVRALGEFDEDETAFDLAAPDLAALAPAIDPVERMLLLAPLVRAWKQRLPAHVAALYAEEVVVPASTADAIWLARDLAALMDEIETEEGDPAKLKSLVPDALAGWWQLTLEFLDIVTKIWPEALAERDRSNPAAHRNARIRAEAERLRASPPAGPVIAAGSTGSIPATAELLSVISRLPQGAVVLPGLDRDIDDPSWSILRADRPEPAVLGHPQYGLSRLLQRIGIGRDEVAEIGAPAPALALRRTVVNEAMRPAGTTELWAEGSRRIQDGPIGEAFAGVSLIEAPNERDEAVAIAVALRLAIAEEGRTAALVTGDRNLARRVAAELRRFGMRADDSGGTPLSATAPAGLLRLMLEAVFRPGDPVPILALLKHPLLRLGLERAVVRHAAETIELVALRGGAGRPDATRLAQLFESRLAALEEEGKRRPFWMPRISDARRERARDVMARLAQATAALSAFRTGRGATLSDLVRATLSAFEALGAGPDGDLSELYAGEAGERLAGLLRSLVSAEAALDLDPSEWPDVMAALAGAEMVKPAAGGDPRVFIWGALEARLQSVDTLVLGGLNEGSWPRRAEADRFMSRMMKAGIGLEPPERRIGLAAHDFVMAMGAPKVVLSRSLRAGDAPAVASRWLQRLQTFLGPEAIEPVRARGAELVAHARAIDAGVRLDPVGRPRHAPPLEARPKKFSVTEIETLRRDPYAVYARRVLELFPLDPLLREPGAAERGTLFHDILHRFADGGADPYAPDAAARLIASGEAAFADAALPPDVRAVWWPRFMSLVPEIVEWERHRGGDTVRRHSEARADPTPVGETEATLSGYADRIDLLAAGHADILDFKTGSGPSKKQAHSLLSPQLALEGALLSRGAFQGLGRLTPSNLAYVRLRPNGRVEEESILETRESTRSASDLSEDAWQRLERLIEHYRDPANGYLSRALPFREGDTDGDYDHLARVLEWSAGGGDGDGGEGE